MNKKIAIWGMGVEGQAAFDFLVKKKPDNPPMIIENNHLPDDVEKVVLSPGVSVYRPEIEQATARGVEFTSLTNIFLSELYQQQKVPGVIAVTGTKGKSTTVSALAFMLNKLGFKVGLGGNIGQTPLDFLGQDLDYIVLELSSFQIKTLHQPVDIGAIINLSRAHVDWHITLENYFGDKLRLLDVAKESVLNFCDERLSPLQPTAFYNKHDGFYVENSKIFDQGVELSLPQLELLGDHNLSNLCCALTILKLLELDYKKALSFMNEFKGLEHRLQKIHERHGLMFIDDSIATVPESVMAAIDSFKDQDVALIIGGYDNGAMDYSKINAHIEASPQVKVAVCLPDTGKMVVSSKAVQVGCMQEAVDVAVKKIGQGVVLLSPGAQSFNMYKNYKERGYIFAEIARQY